MESVLRASPGHGEEAAILLGLSALSSAFLDRDVAGVTKSLPGLGDAVEFVGELGCSRGAQEEIDTTTLDRSGLREADPVHLSLPVDTSAGFHVVVEARPGIHVGGDIFGESEKAYIKVGESMGTFAANGGVVWPGLNLAARCQAGFGGIIDHGHELGGMVTTISGLGDEELSLSEAMDPMARMR